MINIRNKEVKVDIYLTVTSQEDKDVFDIIYEHVKITKRNPEGYTWWGNNQPFIPKMLSSLFDAGQKPQALMVIPLTSGGNGNIRYVADILDCQKYKDGGVPSEEWIPEYYSKKEHTVWLKLSNFREINPAIQDINIQDYYLLNNGELLINKTKSQYAWGYVYRILQSSDTSNEKNKFIDEIDSCDDSQLR